MQKEKFISLLASPFPVNEKAVDEVREITEIFPYFQTAQILYAKLLKESHSIHFDSQLKAAAAYATDRKKLYELIEKTFPDKVLEAVTESIDDDKNVLEAVSELNAEPKIVPEPITSLEEIIRQRLEEIEKEKNKIEEPVFSDAEIQPAVSYNIEEYFTPETPPDKSTAAAVQETENISEPKLKEEIKASFTGHEHETNSFLQWLSYSKPVVKETKTGKPEEPIQKEPRVPVNEIIDKFIEEEPRIAPAKAAFYSPVNMARQSVEEQDDLVSPTLAQIYLAQGNSQKAIETYQRLILLYPEKSAFFAAQIEKIARA
ncbi:MAG: tetratricopeptide repeat protein [Bacteroidia bacterium]